jgi:hypothetical protein
MSAYPFASSAKVNETLDALETNNIATTQQTLLQQILVACSVGGGSSGTLPVNTILPAVSGLAVEGETLTTTNGTWTGTAPITFTYQWSRYTSGGVFVSNVAGATNSTLLLTSSEVGYSIGCTVTGTNTIGADSAMSDLTQGVLSTESAQYFNRLAPYPTTARETAMATFIDGIVDAGIQFDFLHICMAANRASALTNVFAATPQGVEFWATGGLVFTAQSGWDSGRIGNHVDSRFNPSLGAYYTQNSAMLTIYIGADTQYNQPAIYCTTDAAPQSLLATPIFYPEWSDNKVYACVNGTEFGLSNTTTQGLWIAQRTASNLTTVYLDNVSKGTNAGASSAPPNAYMQAMGIHLTRIWGAGAPMDSTQRAAWQTLVTNLVTALNGGTP